MRPPARRSTNATVFVTALAFLASLVALIPGAMAATEVKPYRAVLSPAIAGSSTQDLTLTLYNDAGTQQLGSADLYVPSGVTISNVAANAKYVNGAITFGGVTYAGTIQLRNLAIPAGTSKTPATPLFTASAGCSGGTMTWGIRAKQSNNFSGSPGNDFKLNTTTGSPLTSLTTTFPTDACELRFETQPQDAEEGWRITGTQDFGAQLSPADSTSPQVALVDPATSLPIASFTGTISVALSGGDPTATLSGTKSRAAVAGVATFDNLSVDKAETYTLVASTSGAANVSSEEFEIVQQFCPEDEDCSTSTTGNGGLSSKTITMNEFNPGGDTDTGVLTNRFIRDPGWSSTEGAGPGTLDCSYVDGTTYIEFTDFYSEYEYSNDERTGTIETFVKKKLFNELANNGASKLEVCFQAKLPFILEDGTTESPATDGEPGWFGPGLLPTCNKVDASVYPCIFQQNKVNGDAIVKASVPGPYNLDPRNR
jgi:hypothetical protein